MGQDCHLGGGDFLLSGLNLWATPKKNTPLLSRLPECWLAPVFDITLGPDF
jgi:hypothetical protein